VIAQGLTEEHADMRWGRVNRSHAKILVEGGAECSFRHPGRSRQFLYQKRFAVALL
jgi:hypothetical protein